MVTLKKNGKKVWVTFMYPANKEVSEIALSGEWNEWKEEPMKRKKKW